MNKIKVLVADDHPLSLEGLCRFLEDEEDLEVVARAKDGLDSVKLAKKLKPDVAILDVAMPGIDGLEAAKQIGQAELATAVIILSAYDYESYILAAIKAGVAGYILKDAPMNEVANAIRKVHNGEAVFSRKAMNGVSRRLISNRRETTNLNEFNKRQLEILKLAAKGMGNKEIAKELIISESTVNTHFQNIFRKTKVGSRTAAILYALKNGWLTIDDLL